MDFQDVGRLVFFAGVGLVVLGGLLYLIGRVTGGAGLPGDFRIQTSNVTCFFPLASMIILSIVLTIVLNVVIRLLNR
jgi:hypothetical protein